MQPFQQSQSRREFLRACLAAGAALAVPRWLKGGRAEEASEPFREMVRTQNPSPSAPPVLSPELGIRPRSAWIAHASRPALLRPASAFTRLTVHHEGNGINTHLRPEDVIFDLNGVLEAHLQQSYGDIGYHFVIDRAGRIWEGRPLAYEGAHVSGMNEQNLGVMLLGNFEEQDPATDQIAALFLLVDALREACEIDGGSIYGHCDLGQSACPGRHLYAPYLAELKRS